MSPIPSPTPLRRAMLRAVFSPAGLLFGFVVLIIATCPGARGDTAIGLLAASGFAAPASSDITQLNLPVTPSRAAPVLGRSTRFDRVSASSARPATPAERSSAAVTEVDSFRHSRTALPLLTDPLLDDAARAPSARLSPMVGPAVGIRPKLPSGRR